MEKLLLDVLKYILDIVGDFKSLIRASHVCARWFKILDNEFLIRKKSLE